MEIYVTKNNENLGPYSEEQITQMLESGFLNGQDSCSLDGNTWQPISDFIEEEQPISTSTDLPFQATEKPSNNKIGKSPVRPPVKNIKSKKNKISSLDKKDKIKAKPQVDTGKYREAWFDGKKGNENSSTKNNYFESKESYFFDLKQTTLYPRLRLLINVFFITQIVVGSVIGIQAVFAYFNKQWGLALFELCCSVVVIFLAFPVKEASAVFVDIADSIIERNSREK